MAQSTGLTSVWLMLTMSEHNRGNDEVGPYTDRFLRWVAASGLCPFKKDAITALMQTCLCSTDVPTNRARFAEIMQHDAVHVDRYDENHAAWAFAAHEMMLICDDHDRGVDILQQWGVKR